MVDLLHNRMNLLRAMRFIMVFISFVLLCTMFLWPYYKDRADKKSIAIKKQLIASVAKDGNGNSNSKNHSKKTKILNQIIKNAELISKDKLGRHIKIKAEKLEKTSMKSMKGILNNPSAIFKVGPGIIYNFSSLMGAFDQSKDNIKLKGKVELKSNDGYELKVKDIQVKMKKKKLFSNQETELAAQNYKVKSNKGFEIDSSGKIKFKGKTTIDFSQKG